MTWDVFHIYGLVSIALWIGGAVFAWTGKSFPEIGAKKESGKKDSISSLALFLFGAGIFVFGSFIVGFWVEMGQPPLRTMGETRLWYSLFISVAGIFTYIMWKYKWILSFSTLMSTVFIVINILKPEIHSQELMPALQSPWFIPHVTIYMFSYAFFGSAFILGLAGVFTKKKNNIVNSIDSLVRIGIVFFIFGTVLGSLWAKEAWGNFWSWDPKETWALATLLVYFFYLQIRNYTKVPPKILFAIIIVAFFFLQMCWWGINYLPSASESVHTYSVN